ncbi:MAG: hypothetical protein LH609_16835 [Rudanella sp.]|nr:hypothetical protein [Rudanella sp.]
MKLRPDNAHLPLSMLLTCIVGGLAVWVVEDFSGPLSDGGDTDFYEYVGYFFAHNLTLWPVPHLDLIHDQTFYPYGTNHTLLDWGWERDYWYAFCYWVFGKGEPGPYLQYYYAYSLLVSALGTFWLLRATFGSTKAFVAGLIVSVFNFYCLWKYPVHLNISVVHWTTLCMICTYRLLYELVTNPSRLPSLTLWLLWMWLHIQVLSQELGYVAGFALTFSALCAPFLGWQVWLRAKGMGRELWGVEKRIGLNWFLVGLIPLSLWLYLPLTWQIFRGAQAYAETPLAMKPFWSHPIRLLIPYWPGFDSFTVYYRKWLNDSFESYGQGSPGLYLVILAGVGWWATRRKMALWVPIAILLLLCLVYHPVRLPTLSVFPWFSFNRHGGRASLVYPVLFLLLALSVQWPKKWPGQIAFVAVLLLMLTEWVWGFRYPLYYNPKPVSPSVIAYMKNVRDTPGEAVLDFPFCTIGADGVGDKEGLCPYYLQQNAVFTFRRFHHKKVVGQYWGRLLPQQIQPFLGDHWPILLEPGHEFTPTDWQFLDQFLRRNRFAGINLYSDLLTPAQRLAFYQHYGQPMARARLPMAGRVEFLRAAEID